FLRRWWLAIAGPPAAPVPFHLVCNCGHVTTGYRRAERQVLPCPSCGERLFVLPLSRLPPVLTDTEQPRPLGWLTRVEQQLPWLGPWQLPLLAGGCTFVIVAVVLGFALYESRPGRLAFSERSDVVARRLQAGQQALSQGKFRLAERELSAVLASRQQQPQSLSLAERRQLTQLQRQASLLADLLAEPLEDVLRHAADLTELDEQ